MHLLHFILLILRWTSSHSFDHSASYSLDFFSISLLLCPHSPFLKCWSKNITPDHVLWIFIETVLCFKYTTWFPFHKKHNPVVSLWKTKKTKSLSAKELPSQLFSFTASPLCTRPFIFPEPLTSDYCQWQYRRLDAPSFTLYSLFLTIFR